MTRRETLGAGIVATLAGCATTAIATPHPDAALFAACDIVLAAVRRYNTEGGHVEPEEDPLWAEAEEAEDALNALPPATLAGVMAKARLAHALAMDGTEGEDWRGTPEELACDVVRDLLRVTGKAGR